jgi:hypothetical protein
MDRREFLLGAAGLVLTRGAAAPTLALATADTEAHVVAVSLHTGRVVHRTRTLEGPRSIERGPGVSAIVAHTSQGAVTLLEGSPPRVRRVLRGFGEPRYANVDGTRAYISDSGYGEVAIVDLERGRVVKRVPAGEHARHLTRAGGVLIVSLGSSAAELALLRHGRVYGHIRPPFLAHDVGIGPHGRLWVTAGRERRIAVYADRRLLRTLGADEAPQHIGFAGGLAYLTSGDSGTVRIHDAHGRLRRSTPVARGSYNVQPGANRILTPSLMHGTLTILDHRGRVLAAPQVARAAHDACVV